MGFFKKTFGGGSSIFDLASGVITDPFGAEAEIKGLKAAGKFEEAAIRELLAFSGRAEEAGAPFREAAVGAVGQLTDIVNAPIGESRRFQENLQAGIGGSQAALARLGLADSSTAALSASGVTSNLLTQEETNRQNILFQLLGGGQAGFNQSLGALGIFGDLSGARAQTAAGVGAARGAGQRGFTQAGFDIAGLLAASGAGGAAGGGAGAGSAPSTL